MTGTTTYDESTDYDHDHDPVDLPDGPLKFWPGAGPTPEPEDEGFRQKIIDLIKARREREQREYEDRCKDAADYYGGLNPDPQNPDDPDRPYDPDNPEPDPQQDPNDPSYTPPGTPTPQIPGSPTYGSTTPTPTTPTPTTTYGSGTPSTPNPTTDPPKTGYTTRH